MSNLQIQGYLEPDYLTTEYLTGLGILGNGVQFQAVITQPQGEGLQYQGEISSSKSSGVQYQGEITDSHSSGVQYQAEITSLENVGFQFLSEIANFEKTTGIQFLSSISSSHSSGLQFQSIVTREQAAAMQFKSRPTHVVGIGLQYQGLINDYDFARGVEYRSGNNIHRLVESGYLVDDFLTEAYLAARQSCNVGVQFRADISGPVRQGVQFLSEISSEKNVGIQYQALILDFANGQGLQYLPKVVTNTGIQFRSSLYNTNQLRILCEFSSRGQTDGQNWVASHTDTGDFDVNNVNSDVVEQVWKSPDGVKTGINLDCDTELPQGTFLDTLAILNHNMTTGADVFLIGSNDPTFVSVGTTIQLNMTPKNAYYISPDIPTAGYRYWRLQIDDSSNSDGYIKIGIIVFGTALIFSGECFEQPVKFRRQHFVDSVKTEGFTSLSNSRAFRNALSLRFPNLNYESSNFENLVELFETYGTTHKCLWIPDPRMPLRNTVYGKLQELPDDEEHISNGDDANYVSLSVTIDEAL